MNVHGFLLQQLLVNSLYSRLATPNLFEAKQSYEDYTFYRRIKEKSIFKIVKNPYSSSSTDCDHASTIIKTESDDWKVKVESEEAQTKPETLPISNMSKKICKKPIFKCIKMPKRGKTKDSDASSKKRATWRASEDELLLELMKEHGTRWAQIALHMDGRNGKQVRDRYLNVLKPGRKKARWTKKEDHLLLKQYNIWGHKWCQIAKALPGRTEIQVKNRYYTCLKKRVDERVIDHDYEKIDSTIQIKMETEIETNIEPKSEFDINLKTETPVMIKEENLGFLHKLQVKEELQESLKSEETTD